MMSTAFSLVVELVTVSGFPYLRPQPLSERGTEVMTQAFTPAPKDRRGLGFRV